MAIAKIGVIGSGDVAKALARGFIGLGHDVRLGSRTPEKLADFVREAGEHASAGTFAEAAAFGDIIVIATLGSATEEALSLANPENFRGKVVIDTTNPLDFSGGAPRLSIGFNDSLGERVQRSLAGARVVKAFNTVGNPLMVNPQLPGGPPDMFIGGDDAEAKRIVTQICTHFGWNTIDLGGIAASRYLEPMCMVWVLHGVRSGQWSHAFKMLHA